jgi:hypothetical protein
MRKHNAQNYSIGIVAKMTGATKKQIRNWEANGHIPKADRIQYGDRAYRPAGENRQPARYHYSCHKGSSPGRSPIVRNTFCNWLSTYDGRHGMSMRRRNSGCDIIWLCQSGQGLGRWCPDRRSAGTPEMS